MIPPPVRVPLAPAVALALAAVAGGRPALDPSERASEAPRMLRHQFVVAAAFLVACRTDPPPTGAEALDLGDPCEPAENDPCKDGLTCAAENNCGVGFCLKLCDAAVGCDAVDGVSAVCGPWSSNGPNVCHFPCLEGDPCPTSYAVELECRASSQACIPKAEECS